MISPEQPGPIEDQKKAPPREKQDEANKGKCGCGQDHSPEEEGVDSAHDFMKKFLNKAEG